MCEHMDCSNCPMLDTCDSREAIITALRHELKTDSRLTEMCVRKHAIDEIRNCLTYIDGIPPIPILDDIDIYVAEVHSEAIVEHYNLHLSRVEKAWTY